MNGRTLIIPHAPVHTHSPRCFACCRARQVPAAACTHHAGPHVCLFQDRTSVLMHLAQLSRQSSSLEECCIVQGQSSPSSMRSSYLSPSPPISGRDISALAVIRRPSWSGAARTGSYEGSSVTTGTLQHAPTGSPLQVCHLPQLARKLY